MYCFVSIVLFYIQFVCKCVLYYCHRVSTQLQLNIYHIISNVCIQQQLWEEDCEIVSICLKCFMDKSSKYSIHIFGPFEKL